MRKTIHLVSMTIEEKVIKSCSTIVAAFFPVNRVEIGLSQQRLADNQSAKGDLILRIEKIKVSDISNVFELSFDNEGQVISQQFATKIETLKNQFPLPGKEPSAQIMVKKTVFMFLAGLTGQKNPWGILNGMRPGKLITKMEELGYDNKIQEDILDHYYLVSSEKIKLLQRINTVQKPYREIKEKAKQVAVYLAIPFCPSRCSYCSFPSNPLSAKNKELIPLYLQALEQEIKLTAELMAEKRIKGG